MKNILKGSIVFALVLLIIGCSTKYLDPVPKTSLSDLTVFDTKARIEAQVNGMYSSIKSGAHLGGRFQVYNDVRCDNFIPNSNNGVTNYQTWNHTVLSSTNEVQNLWGAIYTTVNVINVFIDGLTAAWDGGKITSLITQAEYDQYRAEALTLRAICYFDLMQMYSKPVHMNGGDNRGVPLRLKAMKSPEENDLAPSKVSEVYTQILKDLNDAEPLATASYGATSDVLNTTRIHKNTVIALKTRVYLHMQNWAQVVTESAKIVPAAAPFVAPSGVPNALNASYANIFVTPFTSKESILSLPMTSTNNPGTQNNLSHYYFSGSGESYFIISTPGSVYAALDATDARKVAMSTVDGKVYLTKWVDQTTRAEWAPVIRYAEVLLNRAEAIVRAGSAVTQPAVDLLNAVRTRSFAGGAYTLANFPSTAEFYTAILFERSAEFLGEGIRNMDLMRLGLTIPGKDGGAMGNIAAVPPTGQSYIWPVPASELNINKAMVP